MHELTINLRADPERHPETAERRGCAESNPFLSLFKVDKVLVAISAERADLVERGLARLDPRTNQWLCTATAENPERDDWSVAVTAVRELRDEKWRSRKAFLG